MSRLPDDIATALERELICKVERTERPVSGGSIHAAVRVETNRGPIFVKYGVAALAAQFEVECEGSQALARANVLRVPQVLACGMTTASAFAAFEWLDLTAATAGSDERLGEQLARLHGVTAERFGWQRDNFIGATPQPNTWCEDWVDFWRRERLQFQLDLAKKNAARRTLLDAGERLCERLGGLFANYRPVPSLIHGDLWSGNRAADAGGQPVIFDPAVYYADREAELAMCHLFGGFAVSFDRAYERMWPLASGFEVRRVLYQLYHVLNHFNLFGGGYGARAEHMIRRLLAELGR